MFLTSNDEKFCADVREPFRLIDKRGENNIVTINIPLPLEI